MNKEFEKICRMSQKSLKNHVKQMLKKTHDEVTVADGYVYAQGIFPVLLVAHLDTVHEKLPNMIVYDQTQDIISSPNGIGGDDRAGVYMIFEILKLFNCSVLFCEDEEIGGIGAGKFAKSELASGLHFNYIMEFDRANANDAVFYSCANDEFEKFITKDFYKTNYGTYSDICDVAPALGCAAVNLSCGYYKAHTKDEYVVLSEMENSIRAACDILARTSHDDKFEYVEDESVYDNWTGYGYYGYRNYSSYDAQKYYLIEFVDENDNTDYYDTFARSKAEAVGHFVMDNPDIPYANILACYSDKDVGKYI
nr:MAG TPA: hypothetical protein [Bacteriophage sp.]